MDKKIPPLILYGLPLLLAAVLKGLIWSTAITPFNSDEAIVALMARHINQGQLPVFFYGQYYMGSLDALIVAAGFRVFGEHVWVIRLVQSALYMGTVATTVMLASRILKPERSALYAGLLVAIPTVNVALYTTASLGGYGEMLLIGNFLLLGGVGTIEELKKEGLLKKRFFWGLGAWGLGAGFAFWVLGLTLVYSIPVLIYIIWYLAKQDKGDFCRGVAFLIIGGLVGAAPWWGTAIQEGNLAIISELAGGAISGVSEGSWLIQPVRRFINLVVFGGTVMTGLRPPWTIRWLMLPLLPFILILWMAVLINSVRKFITEKMDTYISLLSLMGLVLAVGFIFTPYGDDPSGRYFLPLLIPMSLFCADLISNHLGNRRQYEIALVCFVIIFNLGGIIQSVKTNPPGLTTQFDPVAQVDHSRMEDLIEFLRDNNIKTGYTNYWVSYPLAFLSQEEILFVPKLPYHEDFRYTLRDDRYPPYSEIVKSSSKIAYITTRHPDLDDYLVEQFTDLDISWMEERIGDYTVYYRLSSPVYVDEIGLGKTTDP